MAFDMKTGTVGWIDITVEDASGLRDFYADVAGWRAEPVHMGGYEDCTMKAGGSGEPAAGICHARGGNAGLPSQWLIYIVVEDAEAAAERCTARGGKVLVGPRDVGGGRCAVIEDPAGAVAALYQAA